MTRSQSAGSESTNGPTLSQPALLTSTSMRPNCACTCATMASTDSRDVTSAWMPTPPMASAVSFAVCSLTSVTATVAPSAASFSAMPRPMPCPAPVTIAIFLVQLSHAFLLTGRASRRRRAPGRGTRPGTGEGEIHDQWCTTWAAKSGLRFSANAFAPSMPSGETRVEVQRRHRQVGQARLVVGVGVERLLEEPQRRRALLGDLRGPRLGLGHQLRRRARPCYQAPALGGRRVVEAAQVPHLPRPLLADDAGEVGRAEPGVERADARARPGRNGRCRRRSRGRTARAARARRPPRCR